MAEERKVQLGVTVDATGAKEGFDQVKREAQSMAQAVGKAGQDAGKAIDGLGTSASKSSEKVKEPIKGIGDESEKSSKKVDAATKSMIQSIQRTTAAMEAGSKTNSKYFETLAVQRGVDVNALRPYLAQLDAVSEKQKQTGVSTAQMTAALRQVPAQFTDIVVSLQAGQKPMTVLLQQGGQLKDMFGGIGPAAKALGGYVAGLVNPFTIAAAAGAALAVAYYQGSKEADAYTKALILTGNAAGTTAGQMADMAKNISASVGTQGAAAAALAALAETGKVGASNLQEFSRVAVQVERNVGKSVSETVKDLAELGKSPVDASLKLNEQYHYLTASIYEQIKALQDQGKADEAAEVAQKAYAQAFDSRSKEIVANLGYVEREFNSARDAVKSFWDGLLNIGRKDTSTELASNISNQIKVVQERIERINQSGGGILDKMLLDSAQKELSALREKQGYLQENLRIEQRAAALQAANTKQEEAGIQWKKEADKYLTRQAQMEREIAQVRQLGKDAGINDTDIETRVSDVKRKYSDLLNSGLASLESQQKLEKEVLAGSLDNLESMHKRMLVSDQDYITQKRDLQLKELDNDEALVKKQIEIASGKKDLAERARYLGDLAVLEQKRKNIIQASQNALGEISFASTKQITDQIRKWTDATKTEQDLLQDETELFGKSAEVRKILSAQIKVDADVRQFLAEQQKKNKQLLPDEIAQLYLEADARKKNIAAIMGEQQARAGAKQLRLENQRFAAESIADEQDRAAALLKIDADLWQERIDAAGEGTEAQKKLQEQFDQWYANRQLAPVLDRWKTIIGNLDNDFREGFRDMLTHGKGAWESFSKSLGNTLKTSLADALYQTFIKKYVVQIVASVAGIFSGPAVASALTGGGAGGGANSIGSAASIFNAGKTLWEGFNTGFSSGIGNLITEFGNTIGSQTISGFGAGFSGIEATGSAASMPGVAAGNLAGTVYGTVAPVLAGQLIGRAISGGYSAFGGQSGSAAVNTGTVIGAIAGGPIGAAIGAAVGGVINRAFGMGPKEITGNGISGAVGVGGVEGQFWQSWKQDGGWFRSDRGGWDLTAFDQATIDQLSTNFKAVKSAAEGYAEILGQSADSIQNYAKYFKIDFTDDAQENQKRIAAFFGTVADEMAESIIPNFQQFAQAGETAGATLQRLANTFQLTDAIATSLGTTSAAAFGAVGLASDEAREKMVKFSGGLDALQQQYASFAQSFLTAQEQIAPTAKAVSEQMAALGYANIKTKNEFATLVKDLVSGVIPGLNLTTDAGAELYAKLMALAPAFAQVADAATQALADQMRTADSVRSALTEAYNRESDALKSTIDKFDQFTKSLKSFRESLLTGNLSTLTPDQKYAETRQRAYDVVARAQAGDQDAIGQVQDVIQSFLEASRVRNASGEAYTNDFNWAMQALDSSAQIAQSIQSDSELQLNALNQSVSTLIDINKNVISVEQAIRALSVIPGANYGSQIEDLYQSILNRPSDSEGKSYWVNQLASGMSLDDIQWNFLHSPEYLALHGSHANGLAYVPFDGYRAELHRGERVLTAAENSAYQVDYSRYGRQDNAALIEEIRRLNERIGQLEKAVDRNGDKVAMATFSATDNAADKVVAGTKDAADSSAWANKSKPVLA